MAVWIVTGQQQPRPQGLLAFQPWGRGWATIANNPAGVRHDPQRFMGKTVIVPHFNRDTVEFASRKRDESNPGIKTLLPLQKRTIWRIFKIS